MGIAAAFVLASSGSCGSVSSEEVDAPRATDATPTADAEDPGPAAAPSAAAQTAGGGAASSDSYRLQVSFGAPQPMGRAASASYGVSLGRTGQ